MHLSSYTCISMFLNVILASHMIIENYRYSLRKRPCCIPIRNQCFLFSAWWTNVCCGGVPADCLWFFAILQFPKVEFGKRQLRWNQLLLQGRGGEEGEVYLRPSREAWRLYGCFIRNPVCFFPIVFIYLFKRCRKPVSMLACGSHMVFPLFRLLFPLTTCQTFSHWQGKAALEFFRIRIKDWNWRRRRVSTSIHKKRKLLDLA